MSEATDSGPHGRRRGGILPSLAVALVVTFATVGCSSDSDESSASTTTAVAGATIDPTAVDPAAPSTEDAPTPSAPGTEGSEITTTTAAPTTTTIPPTTTTIIPLVTEGALVLVANAAGVPGAAGQLTAALQAVGYSMKEPTDAAGYEESLDASKIYFRPEAEAAAQSLAAVMKINSATRMPTPAPIVDAQVGLGDATVLIMLGRDLAGQEIPGFAGR